MRLFPSISAAAISGALVVPVFTHGSRAIAQHSDSAILQCVWGAIGILIAVVSVADFSHIAEDWRRGSLFSWRSIARDFSGRRFERIVLPTWMRMGVGGMSAVISSLVLKALGFEFWAR